MSVFKNLTNAQVMDLMNQFIKVGLSQDEAFTEIYSIDCNLDNLDENEEYELAVTKGEIKMRNNIALLNLDNLFGNFIETQNEIDLIEKEMKTNNALLEEELEEQYDFFCNFINDRMYSIYYYCRQLNIDAEQEHFNVIRINLFDKNEYFKKFDGYLEIFMDSLKWSINQKFIENGEQLATTRTIAFGQKNIVQHKWNHKEASRILYSLWGEIERSLITQIANVYSNRNNEKLEEQFNKMLDLTNEISLSKALRNEH